MQDNKFRLHPGFLKRLAEWYHDDLTTSFQTAKEENWSKAARPNRPFSLNRLKRQLAEIIQVSFWASLRREEGRQHPFVLVYSPPGGGVAFKDSRPFDASALAKLAPALQGAAVFGVWPSVRPSAAEEAKTGEVRVWGFVPG